MIRATRVIRNSVTCIGLLGGLLLGSSAYAAEADTWKEVREAGVLRCGAAVSPPYTIRDARTGDYSGVFPELCKGFAEDVLKVKVEFVDTNWDNIVAGLQSSKWDVSLSLNDTPERRKAISFTHPAVGYSVNLTYKKDNKKLPNGISSFEDVNNDKFTVAVMSGTVQDKAISAQLKNAHIMRLPGFDETRMSLMSGRADLLADDSMTNQLLVNVQGGKILAYTPETKLAEQGIALGIRKDTPQADIDLFNQYIDGKKQSGEMKKLVDVAMDKTNQDAKAADADKKPSKP